MYMGLVMQNNLTKCSALAKFQDITHWAFRDYSGSGRLSYVENFCMCAASLEVACGDAREITVPM